MQLEFYGQSAFRIVGSDGRRIVIDPYTNNERIRYEEDFGEADIVAVTHDHGDHANVDAVPGDYEVVRGSGNHSAKGVDFTGIASFHDKAEGAERGPNTVFVFDVDGVRFAHLGDQGCELEEDQVQALEGVEVMIAPVGGGFTLEPDRIWALAERVQPNIFIPCHFKTDKIDLPFIELGEFLAGKPNVDRPGGGMTEISASTLPDPVTVVALEPTK